jgi:NADPH:quinone reductase-like Zn-dependent oxidoreductase
VRRVVIHRPGGYDRLRLEEAPDPEPGPGEVLVDVEAIGVNYADCVVRMGLYASARKYVGWPITPGFEVAGTAGRRRVIAVTRFGGYATKLCVPAHQVLDLPARLDATTGAAFPTVFLTAYYALCELARPCAGEAILVHSAAGGVGGALVQLGKLHGARVVAVVGAPHKVDAARAAGAVEVIDKSREDLWAAAARHAPDGYAAVFDANGVATLRGSYRALAPTGRLVVYGFHSMLPRRGGRPNRLKLLWDWLRTPRFDPIRMTGDNRSVMAFNLSYLFDERDLLRDAMARLFGWLAEGKLKPPPVTTYPLVDVARAHQDLESGATVGKLVLVP